MIDEIDDIQKNKLQLIKSRISYLTDDTVFVVIQKDDRFPQANFVQVDEFSNGHDYFSTNPETLNTLGYKMPSSKELLSLLPKGKYKMSDIKKQLQLQTTVKEILVDPTTLTGGIDKVSQNFWLNPQGQFTRIPMQGHNSWAFSYLANNPKNDAKLSKDNAQNILHNEGWIAVVLYDIWNDPVLRIRYNLEIPPNATQEKALKIMIDKFNDNEEHKNKITHIQDDTKRIRIQLQEGIILEKHKRPKGKKARSFIVVYRYNPSLEVLLVSDKKGRWTLPGGQLDMKENFEDAAWRELKEETGVVPEDLIHWKKIETEDKITDIYHAEISNKQKAKAGSDASGVKWQLVDELSGNIKPFHKSVIRNLFKEIRDTKKEVKECLEFLNKKVGISFKELLTERKRTVDGYLIVLEGIDGAGKSTQCDALEKWLHDKGWKVTVSKWNNSPHITDAIKKGKKERWLSPTLFSLLNASDMVWRYENVIKPALEKGHVVICDRFYYTSYVRDSLRGVPEKLLDEIYKEFPEPDVIFHFIVPPELAMERLMKDKGVKWYSAGRDIGYHEDEEKCALEYEKKMDEIYRKILPKIKNYKAVDTEREIKDVFKEIKGFVREKLQKVKRSKFKNLIKEMANLHLKGKIAYSGDTPLKQLPIEHASENVVFFRNDKDGIFAAGYTLVYFLDTHESAELMKTEKIPLLAFPKGTFYSGGNPITDIWKKKYQKPGTEHIIGALEGITNDELIHIEMISVRPGWRRNQIASKMISILKKRFPNAKIDTSSRTDQGEKFYQSLKEGMFPKEFNRHTLGSCMSAAELATNYLLEKGRKDFKIVEGWVAFGDDWELYKEKGKIQSSGNAFGHTWIEFDNGRIFDPTKNQWKEWGFDPADAKIVKIYKKYRPQNYLNLCLLFPDAWQKFKKVDESVENINERLTFADLYDATDDERIDRSRTVRVRPLLVTTENNNEMWKFSYTSAERSEYKKYGGKAGHKGNIHFFKDSVEPGDNAEDLDCMVDCDCRDFKFRWAYANAQDDASFIGGKSLNKAINRPPIKTNPTRKTQLCKHLAGLSKYLTTNIDRARQRARLQRRPVNIFEELNKLANKGQFKASYNDYDNNLNESVLNEDLYEYFYHATTTKALPNIVKSGLIPSTNPNWGGDLAQYSYGKVFVTKHFSTANYYGNIIWRNDPNRYRCILRFKYNKHRFIPDKHSEVDFYVQYPLKAKFEIFVYDENTKIDTDERTGDTLFEEKTGEWRLLSPAVADAIYHGEWDGEVNDQEDLNEELQKIGYDPDEEHSDMPIDWDASDVQILDKWSVNTIRHYAGLPPNFTAIYRAIFDVNELNPKFAEDEPDAEDEKSGYDWEEFIFKKRGFPPVLLMRNEDGSVHIMDGNHRIHWAQEQGFQTIGAWVVDKLIQKHIDSQKPITETRIISPEESLEEGYITLYHGTIWPIALKAKKGELGPQNLKKLVTDVLVNVFHETPEKALKYYDTEIKLHSIRSEPKENLLFLTTDKEAAERYAQSSTKYGGEIFLDVLGQYLWDNSHKLGKDVINLFKQHLHTEEPAVVTINVPLSMVYSHPHWRTPMRSRIRDILKNVRKNPELRKHIDNLNLEVFVKENIPARFVQRIDRIPAGEWKPAI